jgi:hypothetical protein
VHHLTHHAAAYCTASVTGHVPSQMYVISETTMLLTPYSRGEPLPIPKYLNLFDTPYHGHGHGYGNGMLSSEVESESEPQTGLCK